MSTPLRFSKAKSQLAQTDAITGAINLRCLASNGKPPNRFLSLDIETEGGTLSDLNSIDLVVAGVVEFTFKADFSVEYRRYEKWGKDNTQALSERLMAFEGLIIGMNLFGFDYPVLRKYIDVDAIRHKTLDFQLFLRSLGGQKLSLNNLAKSSLGKGQVSVKRYSSDSNGCNYKAFIKRNRNDCELTAKLYVLYLSNGFLFNRPRVSIPEFIIPIENVAAIDIVTGCREQVPADDYRYLRKTSNRFLGIPWIEIEGYNTSLPSYFPLMKCSCEYATVICVPSSVAIRKILSLYRCPQCKRPTHYQLEKIVGKDCPRYNLLCELYVYSHKALTTKRPIPWEFLSEISSFINESFRNKLTKDLEGLIPTFRDFQKKYEVALFQPEHLSVRIRKINLGDDRLFNFWAEYIPLDFTFHYKQFRRSSIVPIPIPKYFSLDEFPMIQEADGYRLFSRNQGHKLAHSGRLEQDFRASLKSSINDGTNRRRVWEIRKRYYSPDFWKNLEALSHELSKYASRGTKTDNTS